MGTNGNQPVVEAVGGGHEYSGGEDGGGAHEVRLARALPQEQGGQPGEAAVLGLGGPGAVLVSPDDPAPACSLLRPGQRVNNKCMSGGQGTGVSTSPSLLRSLRAKTNHSL